MPSAAAVPLALPQSLTEEVSSDERIGSSLCVGSGARHSGTRWAGPAPAASPCGAALRRQRDLLEELETLVRQPAESKNVALLEAAAELTCSAEVGSRCASRARTASR